MRSLACITAVLGCALAQSPDEWPVYGRDAGGTKYSPLAVINRENVAKLQPAWTFRTGDMYDPKGAGGRQTAFECTPLFIDGTLYVSTPLGRVIALDPVKGTERWSFDSKLDATPGSVYFTANTFCVAYRQPGFR